MERMTDKEKVIKELKKLREYINSEVHPILSPNNWDVYSGLIDLIDEVEENARVLLKEQDSLIENARSQGWNDGYNECEREYQENM